MDACTAGPGVFIFQSLKTRSFLCVSFVFVHLQPLSHSFRVCLQMHDIVKAVGNCSYNQLVEKIISCKQSDNSELAGEGECPVIFLSFLHEQRVSLKFSSVSPGVFAPIHRHAARVRIKPGQTCGSSSNDLLRHLSVSLQHRL